MWDDEIDSVARGLTRGEPRDLRARVLARIEARQTKSRAWMVWSAAGAVAAASVVLMLFVRTTTSPPKDAVANEPAHAASTVGAQGPVDTASNAGLKEPAYTTASAPASSQLDAGVQRAVSLPASNIDEVVVAAIDSSPIDQPSILITDSLDFAPLSISALETLPEITY